MKNCAHILVIAFAMVFMSCKDERDSNKTKAEISTDLKRSNQTKEKPTNTDDFKTYSGAELNDWLPNKIMNYVKEPTSLEFGTEELHQIKAYYQYQSGHDKYIELEITNGQSEKDLRIKKSIVQRIEMNFAEDTESGYTKVHKRKNIEVFEMQDNYSNSSTLQYIINNQFYVRLNGSSVKAEELWQFADQLDFESLMNN